ncbi:hypothetical protein ElyMa_006771000 [Elysia marginata]|uniref:Uncharacterized protein n=1 Tax=Elysia marginata TaxID=1093978 RepID=A0AAV4IYB8_9GAST|nr:hypothetical protein ElyMa_006771000 [Elysia marginata]
MAGTVTGIKARTIAVCIERCSTSDGITSRVFVPETLEKERLKTCGSASWRSTSLPQPPYQRRPAVQGEEMRHGTTESQLHSPRHVTLCNTPVENAYG